MLSPETTDDHVETPHANPPETLRRHGMVIPEESAGYSAGATDWSIYDSDYFAVSWFNQALDPDLQDFLQPTRSGVDQSAVDIPLFPLTDSSLLLSEANSLRMP